MKRRTSYGILREENGLAWMSVESAKDGNRRLEGRGLIPDSAESSRSPETGFPGSSQPGIGVIPGDWVKTHVTRLPQLRGTEMLRALKAWVAREDGVQVEDLALAWRILDDEGQDRQGEVSVYLAHASREKVDEAMSAFESRGLRPRVLLPDYLVIDQYIRAMLPEVADLKAWSFVHLDGNDSFLCVATSRSLLLHRSLPKDLSQGADEAEYIERLATEILRSVHRARQSQSNLVIESVFLSGDERLSELLATELRSSQPARVSIWKIADGIESGDSPLGANATIPAAAALVASLDVSGLNLLPKRRKGIQNPRTIRRVAIAAASLAAILLPLAVGGSLFAERQSIKRMEQARRSLEDLQPVITEAEATDRRWRGTVEREDVIGNYSIGADGLERVLADLALRTPVQIRLDELKILLRGEEIVLQVSGESSDDKHADAQEAFLVFVASLDDSKFLSRTEEPGKLTISEVVEDDEVDEEESSRVTRKRVVFSLEYEIEDGKSRGGRS